MFTDAAPRICKVLLAFNFDILNQRRYNAPHVDEVGVIAVGADEKSTCAQDIIIQPKHGPPKPILVTHSCYDSMH